MPQRHIVEAARRPMCDQSDLSGWVRPQVLEYGRAVDENSNVIDFGLAVHFDVEPHAASARIRRGFDRRYSRLTSWSEHGLYRIGTSDTIGAEHHLFVRNGSIAAV